MNKLMTGRMRCLVHLAWLAAFAVILPAGAVVPPEAQKLDVFGQKAAAALDSVGQFDDNVMALDWKGSAAPKSGFAFYGKGGGAFEPVNCEESQRFHIVAQGMEQARFNLGACKREALRVRDLAAGTEHESYRKVSLPGGATGYAFTLLIAGHGATYVHSGVVYDPSRQVAFVAQATVLHLCAGGSPTGKPTVPTDFCPDTNAALLKVATDLARSY